MYLQYTIWYRKMCEYCEMAQIKLNGICINSQARTCVCVLALLSNVKVHVMYLLQSLLCTADFQSLSVLTEMV